MKTIASDGLCHNCYQKQYNSPKQICKNCGELKLHKAHGLCRNCYEKQHDRPKCICKECGKLKLHSGLGLCKSCYQKQYEPPKQICKECGELKPHYAYGLCHNCYELPKQICKECGELKPHHGKELCKSCFSKQYEPPKHICKECGELKTIEAYGLCRSCYLLLRYNNDPQYKLASILRSRNRHAFKGKLRYESTLKLLGCSYEYVVQYMEKKFTDGMSWANHGHGLGCWHIDHIIPLNTFDLTNESERKKACHYTNLRPLWQPENMSRPQDGSDLVHNELFKEVK